MASGGAEHHNTGRGKWQNHDDHARCSYQCHGRRAQDFPVRSRINAAGLQGNAGPTGYIPCDCAEGKQGLIPSTVKTKSARLLTLLRRAAQPETLRRLAHSAGREVDDLAAQFFGRPLFVGQLKVCGNVKLNQFRHHILLTGSPVPSGSVLQEPPQKSESNQAHRPVPSLTSSKLSATYRNTEPQGELLAAVRQKAQVW